MLRGSELLNKLKEFGNASKSEVVRACGYVTPKQDGGDRLNYTAFYEALLEAKGMSFGGTEAKRINPTGRKLRYTSKVHFNGNLLIGKAYTAMLGLKPGDEFDIKLERKGIRLIPKGTAGDRMPAFEPEGSPDQPPTTPKLAWGGDQGGDREKTDAVSIKPSGQKSATQADTKPTKAPDTEAQPVSVANRPAADTRKVTTTSGAVANQVISIKPALPAPASATPVVSTSPPPKAAAAPAPVPTTPPPMAAPAATPKVEERPQVQPISSSPKASSPKATERPVDPSPPIPSPMKDLSFSDVYSTGNTTLEKLRGEGDIRLSGDLWESALQQIDSPSHEDRWDA